MNVIFPLILCGLLLIPLAVIVIAALRYISYRETLALAEKGLVRPERSRDGKDTLRWGIIITALGLALTLGLYPFGLSLPTQYPLGLGPWMLLGFVPLFFGLALILIYYVTYKSDPKE